MYKIVFRPQAEKELKKLPVSFQLQIVNKLKYFLSFSDPLHFASSLKDHDLGGYRFRIGNYRVIFDMEGETLIILSVGHRREIYK